MVATPAQPAFREGGTEEGEGESDGSAAADDIGREFEDYDQSLRDAVDGSPTSIGHRLFRHDMIRKNGDAAEEVMAFIHKRARQSRPDENGEISGISDMLVRAIMAYGERFLLTEKSKKPWRMGHGSPIPYETMTGSRAGKIIQMKLGLLPQSPGHRQK